MCFDCFNIIKSVSKAPFKFRGSVYRKDLEKNIDDNLRGTQYYYMSLVDASKNPRYNNIKLYIRKRYSHGKYEDMLSLANMLRCMSYKEVPKNNYVLENKNKETNPMDLGIEYGYQFYFDLEIVLHTTDKMILDNNNITYHFNLHDKDGDAEEGYIILSTNPKYFNKKFPIQVNKFMNNIFENN